MAGPTITKLSDWYKDSREFTRTLVAAEKLADGEKEEDFVADIRVRFENFGMQMYMSEKQYDWLERISTA